MCKLCLFSPNFESIVNGIVWRGQDSFQVDGTVVNKEFCNLWQVGRRHSRVKLVHYGHTSTQGTSMQSGEETLKHVLCISHWRHCAAMLVCTGGCFCTCTRCATRTRDASMNSISAFLQGSWRLSRLIVTASKGDLVASAEGVARFFKTPACSAAPSLLLYREEGNLKYAKQDGLVPFAKQHWYKVSEQDAKVDVHFTDPSLQSPERDWNAVLEKLVLDDSNFFHSLRFPKLKDGKVVDWANQEADVSTHYCGKDVYAGNFRVLNPSSFSVTWQARGPSKDWDTTTTYDRAEDIKDANLHTA